MDTQTIITVLATLGVGSVVLHFIKLWSAGRREKRKRLDTSYVADIDADKHAFDIISNSYAQTMAELKEIRDRQESLAVHNATLTAQNDAMQQINNSQTTEIEALREKLDRQTKMYMSVESDLRNEKLRHNVTREQLHQTQLELSELREQVNTLMDAMTAKKALTEARSGAAKRALADKAKKL